MRINLFPASVLIVLSITASGFAQVPGQADISVLAHARNLHLHQTPHDLTNGRAHARFGIPTINSVPNFNGQFFAEGFDANGNLNTHWYTNTVGNPPQMGGTTTIRAPIQPVNVELDDVNGNLVSFAGNPLISPMTQFVAPILASPVFSNASYTSSDEPTQYTDAIMRAEFFNQMKPDWHTLLVPSVLPAVTLHLSQSASCSGAPNFTGCNYVFIPNADNTCCLAIVANATPFFDQLFNIVVPTSAQIQLLPLRSPRSCFPIRCSSSATSHSVALGGSTSTPTTRQSIRSRAGCSPKPPGSRLMSSVVFRMLPSSVMNSPKHLTTRLSLPMGCTT